MGYLGSRFLVDRTLEYQSPNFHTPSGQVLLAGLILVVAALSVTRQRPTFPWLLVVASNLAFALYSARNIPLFAVTALPLTILHANMLWQQSNPGSRATLTR